MVRMKWLKSMMAAGLAAILILMPCSEVFAATAEEVWAAAKASGQKKEDGTALPASYGYSRSDEGYYIYYSSAPSSEDNESYLETFIISFPVNPSWLSAPSAQSSSGSSGGGGDLTPAQIKELEEARRIEEEEKAAAAENLKNSTTNTGLRSTAPGSYMASSLEGVATTQPKDEINKSLGMASGETIHISTWDMTSKSSPAAYASLEAVAASVGGKLGPTFEFDANKMSDGKLIQMETSAGSIEAAFGIPADFRKDDAQYAVAQVVPGGEAHIYRDKDNNPNTITADLSVGNSAAALVQLPGTSGSSAKSQGNSVRVAPATTVSVSADPASLGDAVYSAQITDSITSAPLGGTVKVAVTDAAYLNGSIVSSLETRSDVSMELSTTHGGVSFVINIPAGCDLRPLMEANGKIGMQKMITLFGRPI